MTNEHGGLDVIARLISDAMRVPLLDELRAGLSDDEYRKLLELSQSIVESTAGSNLPPWLIGLAFVAAAETYMAALDQGAAIMGRGPHGSN